MVEEFSTLAAALAAIRDDVQRLGCPYAEVFALFQEATDQPQLIAEGAALVELALSSGPAAPPARAS